MINTQVIKLEEGSMTYLLYFLIYGFSEKYLCFVNSLLTYFLTCFHILHVSLFEF